jgi:hypothetical protein
LLPWAGVGRALMGFLVSRRMFLAPEPLLRNATGRRSKEALPDAEAKAACDELIQQLGGDVAAAVDLLATAPADAMGEAAAKEEPVPVYHFEVELSAAESPLVGSGHGVDMALLLRPDGPELSVEQQASGCRSFFGRDALGTELERAADDLRDALVRFAAEGAPERFGDVPWLAGGTLVVGTSPQFREKGADPMRELARQTIARCRVHAGPSKL